MISKISHYIIPEDEIEILLIRKVNEMIDVLNNIEQRFDRASKIINKFDEENQNTDWKI